jgi:hypothetical protein
MKANLCSELHKVIKPVIVAMVERYRSHQQSWYDEMVKIGLKMTIKQSDIVMKTTIKATSLLNELNKAESTNTDHTNQSITKGAPILPVSFPSNTPSRFGFLAPFQYNYTLQPMYSSAIAQLMAVRSTLLKNSQIKLRIQANSTILADSFRRHAKNAIFTPPTWITERSQNVPQYPLQTIPFNSASFQEGLNKPAQTFSNPSQYSTTILTPIHISALTTRIHAMIFIPSMTLIIMTIKITKTMLTDQNPASIAMNSQRGHYPLSQK